VAWNINAAGRWIAVVSSQNLDRDVFDSVRVAAVDLDEPFVRKPAVGNRPTKPFMGEGRDDHFAVGLFS
jgi:hypothetical protein